MVLGAVVMVAAGWLARGWSPMGPVEWLVVVAMVLAGLVLIAASVLVLQMTSEGDESTATGAEPTENGHEFEIDDDLAAELALSPVRKLCNLILLSAVNKSATELHIERDADSCSVWYEIDGEYHCEMKPPLRLHDQIIEEFASFGSVGPRDLSKRSAMFGMQIGDGRQFAFRLYVMAGRFGDKLVVTLEGES